MSADLGRYIAELTALVERLIFVNKCLVESQSWKTLHVQILKEKIVKLEQKKRRRVNFSNKITVIFV